MEDAREQQKYAAQQKNQLANLKKELETVERVKTKLQERVRVLQQQLQRQSLAVRWDKSQCICLGKKRTAAAAEAEAST